MMINFRNLLSKLRPKVAEKPLLPAVTLPYNQVLKKQQERWIITLIIILAVTGFYSYFYVQSYQEKHEIIKVWAAKSSISAPQKLQAVDLMLISLPRKSLPEGAYAEDQQEKIIDQIAIQDLAARQILLPTNFQKALDPKSISAKFEDSYAFAVDEDWFESKFPMLKKNDTIDILVSNPKSDLEATAVIVTGVKVISLQSNGAKKTLVLNLTTEESKSILFARGLRLPMQVLVHSAISKTNKSDQ